MPAQFSPIQERKLSYIYEDEYARLRAVEAALTSLMEFAWYAEGNHTFTAIVPSVTLDKARAALAK